MNTADEMKVLAKAKRDERAVAVIDRREQGRRWASVTGLAQAMVVVYVAAEHGDISTSVTTCAVQRDEVSDGFLDGAESALISMLQAEGFSAYSVGNGCAVSREIRVEWDTPDPF